MLQQLFWTAIAGAAGSLARYGLSLAVLQVAGSRYPWGTLLCNVLGCVLFGLVWAVAEPGLLISQETRLVLLVGFVGAFTTFSTFAFDTVDLFARGQPLAAVCNVAAQNVLGLLAIAGGFALGRQL